MARPKTIFDLDLVKIGRRYRQVFWCLVVTLVGIGVVVAMEVSGRGGVIWMDIVSGVFFWGVILASAVFVTRLQLAMGMGIVGAVVFGLATVLLSVLLMIAVLSSAATVLRLAGAKVGFAGVSESELAKLRPGHCRGCGYDRSGLELLQECPECNRVPVVI